VSRSSPRSAFTTTTKHHAVAQETPSENDVRTPSEESPEPGAGKESDDHEEKDTPAIARSNKFSESDKQRLVFKQIMRTVPHPIAVVTTHSSTAESDETAVIGATVSSFNTVSFSPDLVVSFNLSADSATYRTILDSKHFCLNFPVNNQAGSILADRFIQGNDPPPLIRALQPSMQALYWEGLAGPTSTAIKQYPPAVLLRNKSIPTGDAGFAFAFLCEYQNSLPVGDKVIVTGRLIPPYIRSSKHYGWGYSDDYGNSYAVSHTTMAYVHGHYGTTDNGWGIDSVWKLGDPYRKTLATADEKHVERVLTDYRQRIGSIRHARLFQQGIEQPFPRTPSHHELRASELPLTHLDDLEAYYAERIALAEAREASLGLGGKTKAQSDLPGWQNSLIRKKILLNEKELKKEEALYAHRLRKLYHQRSVLEGSQARTARGDNQDEDKPSAQSDELTRMNDLATHITERLEIVREAQRRKKDGTQSIEIKKMNKYQITRFLESKRQLGYEALKKDYRRDLFQIQEARLSLLELENRPGANDEEAIKNLKERISYYTEAAELIGKLIVERVTQADPMELNAMIKRPLHGMEVPPPLPEPRVRKINGNGGVHGGVDAGGPVTLVHGIKDDEGHFKFPLEEAMKKSHTKQTTQATGLRKSRLVADRSMAQALEEAHASQVAARHTPTGDGRSSDVKDKEGQDDFVMKHEDGEEIPTWPHAEKTG